MKRGTLPRKCDKGRAPGYNAKRGEAVYRSTEAAPRNRTRQLPVTGSSPILQRKEENTSSHWVPTSAMPDGTACFQQRKWSAYTLSICIAFGSIFIKKSEHLTDCETVAAIQENHYMQYFLGLLEFRTELLSDASLMVHFRKWLPVEQVAKTNHNTSKKKKNMYEPRSHVGENRIVSFE